VTPAHFQLLAVCAAFWLALWQHDRRAPDGTARFALALLIGAALARAGQVIAFEGTPTPRALLAPESGVSILFVPLGVLLLAPTPAAFASLPLPLAVARLGCVAAGCCRGDAGEPLALVEAAALLALHRALERIPPHRTPAAFALAFGAIRLLEQPWRAAPERGFAWLAPTEAAVAWLAAGLALYHARPISPRIHPLGGGRSREDVVTIRGRFGEVPRVRVSSAERR
jgi:hypothetical protein